MTSGLRPKPVATAVQDCWMRALRAWCYSIYKPGKRYVVCIRIRGQGREVACGSGPDARPDPTRHVALVVRPAPLR